MCTDTTVHAHGSHCVQGNEHIIQWGPTNSTRKYIPAVYTTNGTHPKGSMWARGPIPTCAGANGGYTWHSTGAHTGISAIDCEQYPWQPQALRQTQFPAPLPGLYGWGNDYTDLATHKPGHYMPYFIIDRLQVPVELEAGDYVVSWRWVRAATASTLLPLPESCHC